MLQLLKGVLHRAGRKYIRAITRSEAESQEFRRHSERGIEYSFVLRQIARFSPHSVLDVGTGTTALPAILRTCGCVVTASDNVKDYWPSGMVNRHWYVVNDSITQSQLGGGYNMVTCVSVLEHISEHLAAVREMFRLLVPGGHLVLTCPYTENRYVENVFVLPGVREEFRDLPYFCRSYSRRELDVWLAEGKASILEQEYWSIDTGWCHGQGNWLFPPVQVGPDEPHQLTCLLLLKGGKTSSLSGIV